MDFEDAGVGTGDVGGFDDLGNKRPHLRESFGRPNATSISLASAYEVA